MKVDTYVDFPIRGLSMDEYVLGNLVSKRGNLNVTRAGHEIDGKLVDR